MKAVPSVTPEQMRKIDRIVEKRFHVSVLQMMENDGKVIANLACRVYRLPKRVTVLVGKGNNGGGGLSAARHLHNRGVDVSVVLASKDMKPAPRQQLKAVKAFGIRIGKEIKGKPDLIIDALLGYSGRGPPRERVAELILQAQGLTVPVLCNDVPSGLDLSTGKWFSPSFRNSDVITLGLPKTNMVGNPGIKRIFLADIGIPKEAYSKLKIEVPAIFDERDCIELTAQHALGL